MKKTLILLIIACFFTQSIGMSCLYGTAIAKPDTLRPVATAIKQQIPQTAFMKEKGRWHKEPGKEKWYEIHYNKKVRGWVWFEKESGVLKVESISVSTTIKGWEDVYKATLLKLHNIALEEGIQQVHFKKVSNDIFLKYLLEYFSINSIRTQNAEWHMPIVDKKQLEPYAFLSLSRQGVTIVSYDETERKVYNYFSTGPNFTLTVKNGDLVINPSEFRRVETPGAIDHYSVIYDAAEKRFRLFWKEGNKVIRNVDFQLGAGYLKSTLELVCKLRDIAFTSKSSSAGNLKVLSDTTHNPIALDLLGIDASKTKTVPQKGISNFKGLLIFDLDGTLYDCPEYDKAYWQYFFDLLESKGISNQQLSEKRTELGNWDLTAEFFNVSFKEIQENAIEHIDINKFEFHKKPKLIKILKDLKSQGYRLAVLTNNNRLQTNQVLDKLGLKEGIFEKVFTSNELTFFKPNPMAFSEVLTKMNIDDPSKVVSIGNNLNSDIKPPKIALGIPGVLVKGPDDIINNLGKRLKKLDRVLSKEATLSHRKSLPLTFYYSEKSELKSVLARNWQEKKKESQVLHIQQVGLDPATHIGIIGGNPYLVREFAREFTLSGLLWKTSIRHNLLFVLENETVKVYVDKGLCSDKALSQSAKNILDTSKEHMKELGEESAAKIKNLALVAKVAFFKNKILEHKIANKKDPYSFASVKTEDPDKYGVIYGAIKQSEAEELIQELIWHRYRSLNKLGHIFIHFNQDTIAIESEREDKRAKQDILDFIEGFRDIVIFSDTHIAEKGKEDNFGTKKEKELVKILDEAIARRSLVLINGDFLELWQAKYGNIKRSYSFLFSKLRKVRRIIYVSGNHDEDILQGVIDKHHKETLKTAKANIVKKTSKNNALHQLIKYPRIKRALQGYNVILSKGFSSKTIVLEEKTFYIDENILKIAKTFGEIEAMWHLSSLIKDRLQNLNEIVKSDLGGKQVNSDQDVTGGEKRIEILSHYLDEYRRLYFEHGHIPDPFNYQARIGRTISWVVGQLERAGWKDAEYDLNKILDKLVSFTSKIFPKKILHQKTKKYAERALALGRTLGWYISERGLPKTDLTIFFGHTHIPVDIGEGPINALLKHFLSMFYGNTGTWSSAAENKIRRYPPYIWQLKDTLAGKEKKEKITAGDIANKKSDKMKYWFLITTYRKIFLNNGYIPVSAVKKRNKVSATVPAPSLPKHLTATIPPALHVKNILKKKNAYTAITSSA